MTTKTNRFASILLVLAMLLTAVLPSFAALAEGTAKVTFVSSAAEALKPGDTFTVTPKIEDNPGFAGVTWKLEYDNEALELVSIQKSRAYLFGGGTFIPNVEYGQNNLVYANGECEIENGDLCVLNFKVRENAAAGDYTVSVAKSDADFKFVALNSVNVPVDFTPCTVQVAGSESEYANAQIVYCKGTAGAYEYIPVGDTLYINNYAKQGDDREVIAEYKIAVVNKNEIVSEMSDDQWAVEGSVFKTAAHVASDPKGVFTVNATGKLEDAAGKLTATLPDGTALTTNVHVTKTPWKITPNGVAGISGDQYRSSLKAAYAYVGDTFKFTYQLQTATNGTVKGTNLQLRFSSANDKIASVAADGTITAVGKGSTKITVSAVGYNYGVPTEIALLNPIDVYVDPDYITNFVLADADGNVRTENIAGAKGTVPQLTMNAGEEITLFVKGMPNLANAECSGTIASQKQFTVKTGKTALTATTNDDGSVTLKAGNVTEDTTATVTSPQYYRSKVDSSNLFAETFTLTVNIKAAPDYSKAYLAVRQGKGTADDPYTYQAIGDETVYLNAHGAVGGMSWTGAAGIFAMLGDEPIEGVTWALENKDNAQFDTLNENQYKPGVCVNARASGGKVGANALTATLPNGTQLTAKLEMVFLATKMPITGLDGADVFSARFTGSGDTRQDYYAGSVGSQFTVKYNLLYQSSIMKDADRLATNHVTYRSTNESVATVDENGVVTLVGAGEATINAVLGAKLALRDQELVSTPIHVQSGDYATDYNWYKNGEKLARDYDVSSYTPNTYIYTKTSVEEGKETEFTVKSLPEGTTVSIVEDSVASKDASTVEVTMKDATTLIIKGLKESAALTQVSVKLDRGTGTPSFASIYVTVEKAAVPAVESVTLDKRELSLNVEETDKLTATVLPADADQSILWTSSNEQAATVSENGAVTAVAEGTATITAKSAADETKLATCEVTVKSNKAITITSNYDSSSASNFPKVYGRDGLDIRNVVTVTTEPAGLAYDLKVDLNGILNNTIREAMRYDADTYMLSIRNTTGMLSSIPVVATLKDDPSVTATEMISVNFIKVKVNGLTVADENGNTEGTYKVGDTLILKAVYDPANATMQDTRWESKNTDVATVEMLTDPNGVSTARVTIVGEGTAEIGVWPNNNTYSEGYAMRQTYQVNVPEQPKVEGLTALLGCDQTSVKVGDEVIVNLYVDSDDAAETYNAFQFGVNFTENLTYVGFDGLNTESDYNYVDADGNTVTVSGFGKSKTVSGDTALVTLRFKANAAGEAKVTLPESAAFANGKSVAVSEDLQNIKVLNNEVILNVKKTFAIPVTGGTVNGGSDSIPATEGESTSFKPDAPDDGKRIDEVRINGEKAAPNDDGSYTIPNPTEDTTVEIVTSTVTYKVTFSGNGATDADGAGTASHGTDYRFTIRKDANYNYTVSASVGGAAVTVTGEYEIAGEYVTGDITIVINKTEKTPEEKMRTVTAYLNDGDAKEMEKVAHDAQSYAFTNPYAQTAKPYKATVNGAEAAITETDGGWTIAGPFAGDVAIYFGGVYNVTRPTGVTGEDTAQYQEDYNFTVGADYASGKPTVTIGGVEYALADGTADDDGSVTYVISGASITGDIVITLPEPEATVEVNLYFKAEDVSGTAYNVYLVTAKPGTAMPDGRVYAYDGTAMFWSEEYKAFAYLVSTNSAFTAEEATKHVAAADGDKAQKTIDYGGDVNMSGKTDLNDAQLTYDLYNATYHDFSVVSMEKMLRADVSRDKQIDVADVTAIVAIVRK